MRKNGYNPVRRNRNIGTAKQGLGRNNALRIPSVCHEERVWWENLGPHTLLERSTGSRTIGFLVECTREDCEHACSVDDICQILSLVPAEDIESLDTIILRQPTRKQWLLSPAWDDWPTRQSSGRRVRKFAALAQPYCWRPSILLRCGSGVEISAPQILSKSIVLEKTVTLLRTPESDFCFTAIWNP